MITILRRCAARNIWVATLKVKVTANLVAKPCPVHNFINWSLILKICHRNDHHISPYWDDVSQATFGSLSWRSGSQHDLAAKSWPAHNIVIWSRILQLFYKNDHNVETTCLLQHYGFYLEGQSHSMTLQQNRVQPITSLFEAGFYNYFTEMITILRQCVARNI
jgi:hypothetical protein